MRQRAKLVLRRESCKTARASGTRFIDVFIPDVLAYTGMTTLSDIGKEDDKKLVDMFARNLRKLP